MSDYIVSVIRTAVPAALGWLAMLVVTAAARWGIDVDIDVGALSGALVPAAIAIYYGVVRRLEDRYPVVGWLLGRPAPPTYSGAEVAGEHTI